MATTTRGAPITSLSGTKRGRKQVKVDEVKTPSALTDANVYAFVLKKGPFTGKNTRIRLADPEAIAANGGNRRLLLPNYRYETTSKAIADELSRQIKQGALKDIRREIVMWLECPVPNCGAKFKSNDSEALSKHFMEAHIVEVDAEPEADDGTDDTDS